MKLGTITPHGADVYSYAPDEDDMVTDPLLGQHLEHWGINMMRVSESLRGSALVQRYNMMSSGCCCLSVGLICITPHGSRCPADACQSGMDMV